MVDLYIAKTRYTPEIHFSASGILSIKGLSLLEDTPSLYLQVMDWLKDYLLTKVNSVVVIFRYVHLDTSSVRAVVDIVQLLDIMQEKGFDVNINWYYEAYDEDLLETGEGIQSTCKKAAFNLIKVEIEDLEEE